MKCFFSSKAPIQQSYNNESGNSICSSVQQHQVWPVLPLMICYITTLRVILSLYVEFLVSEQCLSHLIVMRFRTEISHFKFDVFNDSKINFFKIKVFQARREKNTTANKNILDGVCLFRSFFSNNSFSFWIF